MYKLDPAVKTVWTFNYFIRFTIYSILLFVVDYLFLHSELIEIPLKTGILSLILFSLGLICSLVLPSLNYKYWEFEIKDKEIILHRGIINRVRTLAPYSKIQHIDVQQSVLERFYSLSRLVLYTAGTRGADVILPGIPIEYAEQLRDSLKDITAQESL